MARIRTIKPEFFRSEDIGMLTPMTRLLFIGLWTMADKEGRLLDRPRRIAVELFPYDEDFDAQTALEELQSFDLIERYEVDGVKCIQVLGFSKHQRPHPKEPESELPARIAESLKKTKQLSGDVGQSRVLQLPAVESNGETTPCRVDKGKGREGKESSNQPGKPVASLFETSLAAFASTWAARFGASYSPTPADKSQLGRLLNGLDPQTIGELPVLFGRYVEDPDPFLAKRSHGLAYFCTSGGLNKYRAKSAPKQSGWGHMRGTG